MTEHDQGTYMSIYEKLRVQPKQKLLTIIRTFTFNFGTKEYYIKQNAAPESRYTLILVPWKPINLIVPALLASRCVHCLAPLITSGLVTASIIKCLLYVERTDEVIRFKVQ